MGRGLRLRAVQGDWGVVPIIVGLALVWAWFDFQDPHFLTPRNLNNLILQIAVTGTVAIGVVLVLLLGEIDLSAGSVVGLSAAILGVLVVDHHFSWWLATLVMLAAAAAIGAFQGGWSAIVGVPSFVVTLAGLLGLLGLQLHVLGSYGTLNVLDPTILSLTTTYLEPSLGWVAVGLISLLYGLNGLWQRRARRRAGLRLPSPIELWIRVVGLASALAVSVAVLNQWQGVPVAGLILVGLIAVFGFITTKTTFGRHIYAVGGNAEAARRAGIQVTRIRIAVFSLASMLAAAGGLLAVSRGSAASTQTGGGTLLLEAIAAAVIGGTSLFGGRGSVWGALIGALVIGSVSNGLDLTGQPADVKYMVEMAVLLAAVTVDAVSRRGRATAGR
ncbi:sugar ABC transporter permease [bacterium]|nr:MAG: sugar ABC transporter permease [bacterium]